MMIPHHQTGGIWQENLKFLWDKWKVFEPTEDNSSPTRLLFKSIAKCEPDLTFEELVLALVAMKRQDVLDILQKYFSSKLHFGFPYFKFLLFSQSKEKG